MSDADRPKLIIDGDWKRDAQSEKDRLAPKPPAAPTGLEIDNDWKSQAQAEKARLAETQAATPAATAGEPRGLPPADFNALVGTLVTNALMYMGAFPDEMGRAMVSLDHARFHIDLIETLADKVKGNITEAEASDLAQALTELRLRYVEITQAVAKAAAKKSGGAAGLTGAGGAGGPLRITP